MAEYTPDLQLTEILDAYTEGGINPRNLLVILKDLRTHLRYIELDGQTEFDPQVLKTYFANHYEFSHLDKAIQERVLELCTSLARKYREETPYQAEKRIENMIGLLNKSMHVGIGRS